jgi:hypothetical protein
MNVRTVKALTSVAAVLAFSFAQVCYVQAGLPQRVITARLITKNNQPITVNGNNAATGGTILTGATIETPDQVSATIDLGDAGTVELQPNSKIQLDYDVNGNVRVKALRGCAIVRKKTNVLPGEMEIYTDSATEKTDKKRRHMGFCLLPNGQLSAVSAGGLSTAATVGIVAGIGGGIAIGVGLSRGGTTSPAR